MPEIQIAIKGIVKHFYQCEKCRGAVIPARFRRELKKNKTTVKNCNCAHGAGK